MISTPALLLHIFPWCAAGTRQTSRLPQAGSSPPAALPIESSLWPACRYDLDKLIAAKDKSARKEASKLEEAAMQALSDVSPSCDSQKQHCSCLTDQKPSLPHTPPSLLWYLKQRQRFPAGALHANLVSPCCSWTSPPATMARVPVKIMRLQSRRSAMWCPSWRDVLTWPVYFDSERWRPQLIDRTSQCF